MQTKSDRHSATVTTNLPYLLYLPDDYDENSAKQWPFILFLHGAGERGNNFDALKSQGLPKKLEKESLPFIVLAPQCPKEDWWADYRSTLMAMVDAVLANYRVDTSRVYLTGLSMGGRGSWDLATCYPNRFAAVAPICGWGDGLFGYPDRLKRIKHIPVWTFHGDADELVPIKSTQWLVDSLEQYGGKVKLTTYPGVGHDSWTETYDNPELYEWFLEHTLSS
jgi:predicted peptidase